MRRRERALLAVLCVVVLPIAAWLLWAQPLLQARDSARQRLAEAEAVEQWVAARDDEFRAHRERARARVVAPVGIAGIERSLLEAQLRGAVDTLEDGPEGRVDLSFRSVSFREFAAYADRIRTELGYEIAALRIEAGDAPDLVSVSMELSAAD
jgi:type II secretory pathway component PulM